MKHRALLAAMAVAVAPIAWDAWSAARDGWVPEGDSAFITLRTHDVLTSDRPSLGNPTTAGREGYEDTSHPGPLEFVLLALPLRLLGDDAHGMLAGVALINAAAVAGIGWMAHRRGGLPLALWALSGAAVLAWSLGTEALHDPYNPHVLLLPYALLLVLGWSVACGDRLALPLAVAAASLVAQSHAFYALPTAVVAAGIGVAVATFARPGWRWLVASAALGLVLWLPPIVEGDNLAALLDYAGDGPPVQGPGFAWGQLADAVVGAGWLDRTPEPGRLLDPPGWPLQVAVAAALAALAALGVRAHRAGRRATATLVATAGVAVAASLVAASRLADGIPLVEPHSHLHWWVTGMVVWLAAGWALVGGLQPRPALLAGPLVIAAVAMVSTTTIADDRASVSFGAIRALTAAVDDALPHDGPWLVRAEGAQAFYSVEPGLVSGLVLRGVDARVTPAEARAYGRHRVAPAEVAGTILVVSGDEPPDEPAGFAVVARFDAATDARAEGYENTSIFGAPQQLAVFVDVSPDGR